MRRDPLGLGRMLEITIKEVLFCLIEEIKLLNALKIAPDSIVSIVFVPT